MISDRLGQRAAGMSGNVREMGLHAREMVQHQWENLRHRTSQALHRGQERMGQFGRSMESEIRQRPVQWLLISAGIGIAIALVALSLTGEHD